MADAGMADVPRQEEATASRATRPTTDINAAFQLLIGLVGTAIVHFAVQPVKDTPAKYLWAIICNRGPVQYAELIMFWMVASFIFMKSRIIRTQLRVIADNPVDPNMDLEDDEQIQDLRNSIYDRDDFSWSIVLNRMDRMLALWLGSKDVGRVATWASSESSRDQSSSDSSYALVRVLIWAIPILGFIGTVQGLGAAVSGFTDFLAGAAEISQIKDAIANVTIGLGVAFDTTLLALLLTMALMFPLSSIQRREETLYGEIDNYLDDMITSHLPSAEQQPVVIENLEDAIEAAFRRYIPDPDRYDEVFTRSIDKAATSVEERFSNLARSYESTLNDLTSHLSSSVAAAGDSVEGAVRRVVEDLSKQEEQMLATRRDLGAGELDRFKKLMEEIYGSSSKLASGYQESTRALQEATLESSRQSLKAAETVSQRMAEVTKLAAGIEDLLRVEQSLQQALDGIAASEDFRATLNSLREHLTTTDEFCSRLSRPRVIRLREETAG